jgi:hypothetical protein
MQTCTVLEANVNRVETWAVRLWAADHAINFPSRRGRDRQVTENTVFQALCLEMKMSQHLFSRPDNPTVI